MYNVEVTINTRGKSTGIGLLNIIALAISLPITITLLILDVIMVLTGVEPIIIILLGTLTLVSVVVSAISLTSTIIIIFNKKHNVVMFGTLYFNTLKGREVGVFTSNSNDVIVMDMLDVTKTLNNFVISVNGRVTSATIAKKKVQVLCNNNPLECSIKLKVTDRELLRYLLSKRYIKNNNDI